LASLEELALGNKDSAFDDSGVERLW